MITYTSGSDNQNTQLEAGEYFAMISKAEVINTKRGEKLKITFVLEDGRMREEWVLPQTWLALFTDLLEASGQEFSQEGGDFDEQALVGVEGTLRMSEVQGKGENADKTYINAERFIVVKPEAEKKS
jgi:hypothetical protein